MEIYIKFFCIIGILCSITMCACVIAFIISEIRDFISKQKYEYRQKHRFDKPPTAKCFCKDCVYHGNASFRKQCTLPGVSRFTPDNGFCYEATPIEYKNAKEHEQKSLSE